MATNKSLVCIVQFGGSFIKNIDGTLTYEGGEAHLVDVDQNMSFDQLKSEVSEMYEIDMSNLAFKYMLPANKRTLITISNDKDLKRMVDIQQSSPSPEIFIVAKERIALNALMPLPLAAADVNATPSRASTNSIIESSTAMVCLDEKPNRLSAYWENAITGVGQTFKDAHAFRDTLRKYAIARCFAYKFVQNDRSRITAKCKAEGCPWRVHASKASGKTIKIKVLKDVHTCKKDEAATASRPIVTKYVVADLIKHKLRDSPDCSPADIVNEIERDYGLKLKYSQAWRAKEIVKEQLLGKDVDSYKELPRYCEKIPRTNPGSIATLLTTGEGRFHRLFISFRASLHGFEHGCRPLLFLDSTSVKLKYGDVLLVASSIDANDGTFPIAFAIVEQEAYESWKWFLLQLKSGLSSPRQITFVSDMKKGLKEAVREVFNNSNHAYSVACLIKNLLMEVKGTWSKAVKEVLSEIIYKAAKTCKSEEFDACVESIRSISPDAGAWITGLDPSCWTNLQFKGSRYDQVSSNVAETFDSWSTKASDLPVLKFVDNIRHKIAELILQRARESASWFSALAPKAEEKLQKEIEYAPSLSVSVCSQLTFEVTDDHVNVVNLEKRECSCLSWKVTGLPCRHAIASLHRIGRNPYDYCERYYTVSCYNQTYTEAINPVMNVDSIIHRKPKIAAVSASRQKVDLPRARRPPGRPRKRRIEVQEVVKKTTYCSRCKGPGHNKKTCKAAIGKLPGDEDEKLLELPDLDDEKLPDADDDKLPLPDIDDKVLDDDELPDDDVKLPDVDDRLDDHDTERLPNDVDKLPDIDLDDDKLPDDN
ncbi:uncharacterized protein LOC116266470 [Nymphaea colorata]|uniref:uncharacterized protein LOC116266470 n=1 Tax=Nymphaea colorata TaxID=210225 RepID=UPI00129EE6B6|nr:uncharacterized protein LOC116266470 [Nymphaea colorata]XP_031503584.1 uncharacterized protein LOC116266470 [Nymphaea colorata]